MSEHDGWIDISVPLEGSTVTWPGDPPIEIQRVQDFAKGDVAIVSRLSMGVHSGTHMDAPLHFLSSGKSIDQMPLDISIGPARVIEAHEEEISPELIQANQVLEGERILFKTANSPLWGRPEFSEHFAHLSTEAARELARRRVRLVGIDYLSVAGYEKNEVEVHRELLTANVWILEGLNLEDVAPGNYELLCLPLKLRGAEGAPARALLRPLRSKSTV